MDYDVTNKNLEDEFVSSGGQQTDSGSDTDTEADAERYFTSAIEGENFASGNTQSESEESDGDDDEPVSQEVVSDDSSEETAEATSLNIQPEASEDAARDFEGLLSESDDWDTLFGADSNDGAESASDGSTEVEYLPDASEASDFAQPEFLGGLVSVLAPVLAAQAPRVIGMIANKISPMRRKRAIRRARQVGGITNSLLLKMLRQMENAPVLDDSGAEAGATASPEEQALAEEAAQVMERIIGTDDRIRIKPTHRKPWPRIVALKINFNGSVYRGTGALISPDTVLTAGHCIYMHNSSGQGRWADSIEVIPGADGAKRPFGSVKAQKFRSVKGWVSGRKRESDYGCIKLPKGAFGGRRLGAFGYAALPSRALLAKRTMLAGYPGDKPFAELWGMARRLKKVTGRQLHYNIDTMGGQSGAPVYAMQNGKRIIVGIHNYGGTNSNFATRITRSVYRNIKKWTEA